MRLLAVLNVLSSTPARAKRLAPFSSAQQELDFLSGLTEFHDLHQMLPKHHKARANKMLYKRREKVSSWSGADE